MINVAETAVITQDYLFALGSNLGSRFGDATATLRHALTQLSGELQYIPRVSRFFATPCFPAGAGPDYVNACAILRSDASPAEVLERFHAVERDFDRQRQARWGSRTLDLDLLAQGQRIAPNAARLTEWMHLSPAEQRLRAPDQLILPHPRLHQRAFVLVPLRDVAPFWRHPVVGRTVAEMTDALPEAERAEIRPL